MRRALTLAVLALVAAALVPVSGSPVGATEAFTDVPESHAFATEIGWMADEAVSTGFPDGTYRPAASLTRQAMSAFMYRLAGSPLGESPTCSTAPFSDVAADHPFCGEIGWMADEGLSTGFPDGTYRPGETLTRQAMSAFMYRLAGEPEAPIPAIVRSFESGFPDVAAGHPFENEIGWMAAAEISTGYPDGTYRPAIDLTRQAMSAFMFRLAASPFAWAEGESPGVGVPFPGDAVDCVNFATYADALVWFEWFEAAWGDPAGLDADSNGIPCEGLSGSPGGSGDPFALPEDAVSTTWDVTLQDDVELIDWAEADAVAHDDGTFTGPAALLGDVSVGDVLMVAGVGFGRVHTVTPAGGELVVTTTEADLGDVIDSGDLGWSADLVFSESWLDVDEFVEPGPGTATGAGRTSVPGAIVEGGEPLPLDDSGQPQARFAGVALVDELGQEIDSRTLLDDEGRLVISFTDGDLTYRFRLQPTAAQIVVDVQVTRGFGGTVSLAYTGTATIRPSTASADGSFDGGDLSAFEVIQKSVEADFELSIAAAGSGSGNIDFDLPGLMFRYVVPVGPVPVTIGLTAKLIGSISVPVSGSATANAKFSYDGDAGFRYDGHGFEPAGTLGALVLDPEPADSAAPIGVPVDAQFGVAFPRFTVSIFEQGIVPFIHTGFVAGTNLTWGPVCKTAYVRAEVVAGYDLKVLGIDFGGDSLTLVEDREDADLEGCSEAGASTTPRREVLDFK